MSWKVGEMWWYYVVRNDIVLINIGLISNWLGEMRIYGCNHSEGNKLEDVFLYRKIEIGEFPPITDILKHHKDIIERRKTLEAGAAAS